MVKVVKMHSHDLRLYLSHWVIASQLFVFFAVWADYVLRWPSGFYVQAHEGMACRSRSAGIFVLIVFVFYGLCAILLYFSLYCHSWLRASFFVMFS